MTYPLIGNYGVNRQDVESWQPHVAGFVIRELSPVVSNWRADSSLAEYLEKNGIPGIQDRHARADEKAARARRAQRVYFDARTSRRRKRWRGRTKWPGLAGVDYVKEVTHKKAFLWDEKDEQSASFNLTRGAGATEARNVREPLPPADIPIVAFDFGMKYNILRRLRQHGFRTQVVPATATAAEALAYKPAGIFLSNGPGDPAALDYAVRTVSDLMKSGHADLRDLSGAPDFGPGVWRQDVQAEVRPSRRQSAGQGSGDRARWKSPRKTTASRWTRRRCRRR